jgi:isopenicillin N synthase-like dioxygenase
MGDGRARGVLGEQLCRALTETGFVRLRRPPRYDYALIHECYDVARTFFDLAESELRKLYVPELNGERGYMPRRVETAQGASRPDEKRYFSVGREAESVHANVWPPEHDVPGFRELTTQCFAMFDRVMYELTDCLGPVIGVPGLAEGLAGGESLWRIINYDALDGSEAPDAARSREHRDASLLTLLPAATDPGLQILTNERWVDVGGEPDELIVNAGDALTLVARAHGQQLPSTVHRVVNGSGARRISAPFFGHVLRSFVLDPSTGITEGEFLDQRLKEIIGARVAGETMQGAGSRQQSSANCGEDHGGCRS